MEKQKAQQTLTPEQQEKKEIELENKLIDIVLPSVSIAAFIIGLLGFILSVSSNVGGAIFLLVLALLGAGGIVYGVFVILRMRKRKYVKPEETPSETPKQQA